MGHKPRHSIEGIFLSVPAHRIAMYAFFRQFSKPVICSKGEDSLFKDPLYAGDP